VAGLGSLARNHRGRGFGGASRRQTRLLLLYDVLLVDGAPLTLGECAAQVGEARDWRVVQVVHGTWSLG